MTIFGPIADVAREKLAREEPDIYQIASKWVQGHAELSSKGRLVTRQRRARGACSAEGKPAREALQSPHVFSLEGNLSDRVPVLPVAFTVRGVAVDEAPGFVTALLITGSCFLLTSPWGERPC